MKKFFCIVITMTLAIGVINLAIVNGFQESIRSSMAIRSKGRTPLKIHPPAALNQAFNKEIDAAALRRWELKTEYRGTFINAQREALGTSLEFQHKISEQFSLHDSNPPDERFRYFLPLLGDKLRIVGWYGSISEVSYNLDTTIIKLRISPRLTSQGAAVDSTNDYYTEFYEYNNGFFNFIKGEGSDLTLKFHFQD